jgi:thiol-disulfide isomerase/thioredoxin
MVVLVVVVIVLQLLWWPTVTEANNPELGKFFFDKSESIRELRTVEEAVQFFHSGQPSIVNFYASWCPHCQRFVRSYTNLAEDNMLRNVSFGAVNCVELTEICDNVVYNVTGFPTLKYFNVHPVERVGRFHTSTIMRVMQFFHLN